MNIWVTRHGQTALNRKKKMQGRVDEPLNETGISQAKAAGELVRDIRFDAVYASPLNRAIDTAMYISGMPREQILVDERVIETEFGRYDKRSYFAMGLRMTLYWALPEVFPAPPTVETVSSMVARSSAFLKELEARNYENVLVVCHGGIIRALCGYLEDTKNGIRWRPKPHNCEIRVYESKNGVHRFIRALHADKEKEK